VRKTGFLKQAPMFYLLSAGLEKRWRARTTNRNYGKRVLNNVVQPFLKNGPFGCIVLDQFRREPHF